VLTYGSVPHFDPARWHLRVFGLVKKPITWSYDEFMQLPTRKVLCDVHCVTTWSKFDNLFEGVPFLYVAEAAGILPEATHVLVHAEQGYTTNLPLADVLREDVLLAYKHNGINLTPEHGWPLRLVVPHLYFWKSAKWVRGLEFMRGDRPGFWEQRGYHMHGDPWTEERYG
jgi:DMSO/TMAO reductase YedYZ molybdopterin-dependent catalytic subunit